MKIGISETQFAFTWLHFYLNDAQRKNYDINRFILPSLFEEGRGRYSGADLVIADNLFIQFKMPKIISKESTKYYSLFNEPYFELIVKNSHPTLQLSNLLEHSKRLNCQSYYISPLFHSGWEQRIIRHVVPKNFTTNTFAEYYRSKSNKDFSICINLSQFNYNFNIEENNKHKILYSFTSVLNNEAFYFSEVQKIQISKYDELFPFETEKQTMSVDEIIGHFYLQFRQYDDFYYGKYYNYLFEDLLEEILLIDNFNKIKKLQNILISCFDILWIPYVNVTPAASSRSPGRPRR